MHGVPLYAGGLLGDMVWCPWEGYVDRLRGLERGWAVKCLNRSGKDVILIVAHDSSHSKMISKYLLLFDAGFQVIWAENSC